MRIKRRARKNKVTLEIKSTTTAAESDPYSMFLFAMRSPKTREKCTGRLRMFFDFLDILPGQTMEERSMAFCEKAKSDNRWAFSSIIQDLQKLKERVERKEITAGTMTNRYQAVKLFCEMADIN